jgi:hypothetical protein
MMLRNYLLDCHEGFLIYSITSGTIFLLGLPEHANNRDRFKKLTNHIEQL